MFSKSKASSKSKATKSRPYRERVSVVSSSKSPRNEFSMNWVLLSTLFYFIMQVTLSTVVVGMVPAGAPKHTEFMAQGIVIAFGFYFGAWLLGVISPGRRLVEPVLGAVLSVGCVFLVGTMTPQMGGWFRLDGIGKMGTAGMIAGFLAAIGVYSGEKIMGNIR